MERLIIMLLLFLFNACSVLGTFDVVQDSAESDGGIGSPPTVDTSQFIEMAQGAACAGIINAMYLVDGQYVIWYRQGDCADASYSTTLFDARTGEALCSAYDSIAGPVQECNSDADLPLFEELAPSQRPDMLAGHTAEVIFSEGGGRGLGGRQ